MAKKTEVLDNKCPGCGGKLDFEPKSGKWACKFCGNSYTLEEIKKYYPMLENTSVFNNIN